jgi:hypothetical protein
MLNERLCTIHPAIFPFCDAPNKTLLPPLSFLSISFSHELIQPTPITHIHRRLSIPKRIQDSAHVIDNFPQFIRCHRTLIRLRNNDIPNPTPCQYSGANPLTGSMLSQVACTLSVSCPRGRRSITRDMTSGNPILVEIGRGALLNMECVGLTVVLE